MRRVEPEERLIEKISLPDSVTSVAGAEISMPPAVKLIPVEHLYIDNRYQRDLARRSERAIKKIIRGFDWARFGVLLCCTVPGQTKTYIIVDGQHRALAALALGIEQVPALVVPKADLSQQAAMFVGVNSTRTNLHPYILFRGRFLAGDPEVVGLVALAAQVGVNVMLTAKSTTAIQAGDIGAYQTLLSWYKKDKEVLKTALDMLSHRSPIYGAELKGLCALLSDGLLANAVTGRVLRCVLSTKSHVELKRLVTKHRLQTGDTPTQGWALVIWRLALNLQEDQEAAQ